MTQNSLHAGTPANGRWAEAGATLSLAGPMIMTMIAVIAMETVDTLMIGRLGEEALASAALALNAWFIFLLFGIGVLGAVSSLASQAVAVGDDRGVRRSTRQGLWAGLMMGTPFALILGHAEPVLIALGQEPQIAAGAQSYLNWMGAALIVVFLNVPLRLTMASYGVTIPAMLVVWSGVPLNALLNWVFMFGGLGGPVMGLEGAGVATLIVDVYIFIVAAIYVSRAPLFARLNLFARFWRPDWQRFRQLMAIGLPAGGTSVLEHGLFAATAIMMGWVGVTQLAAHQVATQIISITFMLPFGLSQAATIRIGLAAGARDLQAVRLRGRTIFDLTVVSMICAAILFWTAGEFLIGLFLAADDPNRSEIVEYGALFLAIAALFQIVDGLQASGSGVLRGMNDTMVPMVLAMIGYWVLGVPTSYYLAFELGLGGVGIWYGAALGLTACAAGVVWRFYYDTRSADRAFSRIARTDAG
ncbi:MAG: MATE family efflux transporter [Alphaproteobacteria bacterium]|nr:MATE family efflux transporter [Alphaproteobacteria bacterium]